MDRPPPWLQPRRLIAMAVPLLVLGAVARLATLDDAEASTDLLSHLDTWAWAVGILLILGDLVLPVPQASVITTLGAIYGITLGTLIGTVGLIVNGVAGYLLMLTPIRRVIERALKGRSAEAIAALSDRAGPWGIALSRSLPYSIPEAMVCLAGLARMPVKTFLVSLGSGSISTALLYAGIGAGWARDPLLALAISYLLPIASLPAVLYLIRRRGVGVVEEPPLPSEDATPAMKFPEAGLSPHPKIGGNQGHHQDGERGRAAEHSEPPRPARCGHRDP
jgi:uncharacterized membrane protein YdjX (TVP38/TMEM64 family)